MQKHLLIQYLNIWELAKEVQCGSGFVISHLARTKSVIKNAKYFDMSNSEPLQFIGRVVNALANNPNIMKKSEKVIVTTQETMEYWIKDIDGKRPDRKYSKIFKHGDCHW